MGDDGDMPCCPYCTGQEKSKASASCIAVCMSCYDTVLPRLISLPRVANAIPISLAERKMDGHVGSPPTHPPPA
jgi:hypothetical protein